VKSAVLHWRDTFTAVAIGATLAGLFVALEIGRDEAPYRLPWRDRFALGSTSEWQAYGGTWDIYDGGIRNNSDERGAKFITGSSRWSNYAVDADVLLLGNDGDAGLIVRSSDEEEGVDSYSGYYVGLRDRNNSVTIGRADHGWIEYQAKSPHDPIRAFHWYHLHVVAVGCDIAAEASESVNGDRTWIALREPSCTLRGRIGLRSYSSGGIWKNILVMPARYQDIKPLLANAPPPFAPSFLQSEAGFNSLRLKQPGDDSSFTESLDYAATRPQIMIGDLKISEPDKSSIATVHGSVILTSPEVYLQDPTGGVMVDFRQQLPLKIGDEVEATGTVEHNRLSSVLKNASGRILWQRSPAPPLSVTAAQAASGDYEAMFVETQGEVEGTTRSANGNKVLLIHSANQEFRVILPRQNNGEADTKNFEPRSVVRVTGVCVVDEDFTENQVPFAVLPRSLRDIQQIAGPPWWTLRNLIIITIGIPLFALMALLLYSRADRWRLQAVLEERLQMAREIHDTLAQGFAGISLQLESALREYGGPSNNSDPVMLALQMAERGRGEAHLSIAALRAMHADAPLNQLLQKIVIPQVVGGTTQLLVTSSGGERRLPVEIEANLLRIVQECVSNTIQHANASRIAIELRFSPDSLFLRFNDDGRGFDPYNVAGSNLGHFGLTGMRERAKRIGATFAISSNSCGTSIDLQVPLPHPESTSRRYILAISDRIVARLVALIPQSSHKRKKIFGKTYSSADR
jgi:signal transduction histidine kinase